MTSLHSKPLSYQSKEDQEQAIASQMLAYAQQVPDYMGRGRELIMNAIEACLRAQAIHTEQGTAYNPEVVIGPTPRNPNLLSFVDNGDGMTEQDIDRHLSGWGISGNTNFYNLQGSNHPFDENKGIGAKGSELPKRNPGGMSYETLPIDLDEKVEDVTLTKLIWNIDNANGQGVPGQAYLSEVDGINNEDLEPSILATLEFNDSHLSDYDHVKGCGHGTAVTLYGTDRAGGDTTTQLTDFNLDGPDVDKHQPSAFLRFLNRRFWDFQGVTVNVRDYHHDKTKKKLTNREATGAKIYLEKAQQNSGTAEIELSKGVKCKLLWYVIKNDDGKTSLKFHDVFASHGFFGIKFRHELYNSYLGGTRELKDSLKSFGIYAGQKRIVLILDLDSIEESEQKKVGINQTRETLYFDNKELNERVVNYQVNSLLHNSHPSVLELKQFIYSQDERAEDEADTNKRLHKLLKTSELNLSDTYKQDGSSSKNDSEIEGKVATDVVEIIPQNKASRSTNDPTFDPVPRPEFPVNPNKPIISIRRRVSKKIASGLHDVPKIKWEEHADSDNPNEVNTTKGCEEKGGVLYFYNDYVGLAAMVKHIFNSIKKEKKNQHLPSDENLMERITMLVKRQYEDIITLHLASVNQIAKSCKTPEEEFKSLKESNALTAKLTLTNTQFGLIKSSISKMG